MQFAAINVEGKATRGGMELFVCELLFFVGLAHRSHPLLTLFFSFYSYFSVLSSIISLFFLFLLLLLQSQTLVPARLLLSVFAPAPAQLHGSINI